MDIKQAQKLTKGQKVTYPMDRGTPGGTATVDHVGETVQHTINGTEYIWITLKHFGHKSVWPSNRLA